MQRGRSALHWAALRGYVDICRLLVAEKANIDLTDRVKKKTIHLFCFIPSSFFPSHFRMFVVVVGSRVKNVHSLFC